MIQLYIPWEGDGGYEQHLEKKTQDPTLSKNINP